MRRGLEASHHSRWPELGGRAADRGRVRGDSLHFAAVHASFADRYLGTRVAPSRRDASPRCPWRGRRSLRQKANLPMIHSIVRSLIVVAGLAWAGCGVEPDPRTSDSVAELGAEPASQATDSRAEPSATASSITQGGGSLPAVTQPPNNGCGYVCHAPTGDIFEVSWSFCLHACPGGPTQCSAGPFPPCP